MPLSTYLSSRYSLSLAKIALFAFLLSCGFMANQKTNALESHAPSEDNSSIPSSPKSDYAGTITQERIAVPSHKVKDLPYKYVGNNYSGKFHKPSCPFAKVMNIGHVELFHFRIEAIKAGQRPCHYCLPQEWRSVRATILPPKDNLLSPLPNSTFGSTVPQSSSKTWSQAKDKIRE